MTPQETIDLLNKVIEAIEESKKQWNEAVSKLKYLPEPGENCFVYIRDFLDPRHCKVIAYDEFKTYVWYQYQYQLEGALEGTIGNSVRRVENVEFYPENPFQKR